MNATVLFALVSGDFGGGQRVALSVAEHLRERGIKLAAVAPEDGSSMEEFRSLGARVCICGVLRTFDLLRVKQLRTLIQEVRADVVYTHTVPAHEAMYGMALGHLPTRFVVHRHAVGNFSSFMPIEVYQRILWKRALKRANQIICVSNQVRNQVTDLALGGVEIVPNGVPIPDLKPRASHPNTRCTVGFVGRFDVNKGLDDFVRMAAMLIADGTSADFVICGAGASGSEYESECWRLAASLGIDERLQVRGLTRSSSEALDEIDILVIPSRLEGHPLVLLEAMAQGIAIVATSIPGIEETVDAGVEAQLVPRDMPKALAAAVAELLGSARERERLGEAARTRASRDFSEERMVKRLSALLLGGT